MKIEYPQIDWKKIAKECPKALKAFYDSDVIFWRDFYITTDYNEAIKKDPEYINKLAGSCNTRSYEITVWMHSIGVYAYTQGSFGTWRPCCNNFVVRDGTNCIPNGLTYQKNLAIAIEKGFEIVEQNINRAFFLAELRSGKYKKGCIKSDKKGKPIIKTKKDNDGYCSCAIMVKLFGGAKFSLPKAVKVLGITTKDCTYIQKYINDTDLTFSQQADEIQKQVFL